MVVPALVVLIGLPAVFSTKGDKRQVLVPTPGPLRVVIEILLYAVVAVAPRIIWPIPFPAITSFVILSHWVISPLGAVGGLTFAIAGPAVLVTKQPEVSLLFFLGTVGIALWLVMAGVRSAWSPPR